MGLVSPQGCLFIQQLISRIVKLLLNNGKHILCEKPLGMNVKETKEILDLAKEKNLFLMEAIWSRVQPSYLKLKEEIDKGVIGEVSHVQAKLYIPSSTINTNYLLWQGNFEGKNVNFFQFYVNQIFSADHGWVKSTVIEKRQQQLGRMAGFPPPVTFSVFYLIFCIFFCS